MASAAQNPVPALLFGAFDRHNFGDLLFPHIVAALLPERSLICAGLAERDLRAYGGHQSHALARFAAEMKDQPVDIVHVGGEILTCEAWQAAVMLQTPAVAQRIIATLEQKTPERAAWVRQTLGFDAMVPYVAARERFPQARCVAHLAVGGVDLAQRPQELQTEVLAKLQAADIVTVRDRHTLVQLESAGIDVELLPDPAVMVKELFVAQLEQCARAGAVAEVVRANPQGYLAVQFSADFGDDATLAVIAAQLDQVVADTGYGLVLFRAGVAPWHDGSQCYARLVKHMRASAVQIFTSLNIWDICALIAHSRGYCGSSLHGRIVAMAYALPRVNLVHEEQRDQITKQSAYADTWDLTEMPGVVTVAGIAAGIGQALSVDQAAMQRLAVELVERFRAGFAAVKCLLD